MKMYKVGDLILYGSTGVCRVDDITHDVPGREGQDQLYYVLTPLYQDFTIYVPTDTTKVFMRPIISRDEAEELIKGIPEMHVDAYSGRNMNKLARHYEASMETYDCHELLEVCISTYAKKQAAEKQNRKLGAIDEKYMKRAEDLLFGELAAALGVDRDQVNEYVVEKINWDYLGSEDYSN
jgi:CarD family transcriptional regulator